MNRRVPVIGLTGGIGSGKSAAADAFGALGAAIVDTDAIAHALTAPGGAAMPALAAAFGPAVVRADGGLDRAAMRARAFADATARARLEGILHPLIRAESAAQVAAARSRPDVPYVVLVVPLLVESGNWRDRVDVVAVVDCAPQTQVERVMARSGLAADEVARIMAAQTTRAARQAAADVVIDNDGTREALVAQAAVLDARWREMQANGAEIPTRS